MSRSPEWGVISTGVEESEDGLTTQVTAGRDVNDHGLEDVALRGAPGSDVAPGLPLSSCAAINGRRRGAPPLPVGM